MLLNSPRNDVKYSAARQSHRACLSVCESPKCWRRSTRAHSRPRAIPPHFSNCLKLKLEVKNSNQQVLPDSRVWSLITPSGIVGGVGLRRNRRFIWNILKIMAYFHASRLSAVRHQNIFHTFYLKSERQWNGVLETSDLQWEWWVLRDFSLVRVEYFVQKFFSEKYQMFLDREIKGAERWCWGVFS